MSNSATILAPSIAKAVALVQSAADTPGLGSAGRSWNAFGAGITQAMMVEAVDAVVAKNRTVKGWEGKVSLCDLGYCAVGIDEGWEGCGMGFNHTQHYINGTPAVNNKFPDMKALVDHGHSKNVKMGFYQNGCACGEDEGIEINYEGDVAYLDAMGFDLCPFPRNVMLF